jgi:peptidoglycan/LPS O-acetylase OafA/YrhL
LKNRIEYLDSVRGLAALSVVYSHFVGAYGLPTESPFFVWLWTSTPLHLLWDGFAAVSFFFVLSGYVLSRGFFQKKRSPFSADFSLLGYVGKRICRIWIPYVACLALSALCFRYFFSLPNTVPQASPWLSTFWQQAPSIKDLTKEVFLIFKQNEPYFFIPPAWTLSTELIMSIFVPLGIVLAIYHSGWLLFFSIFFAVAVKSSLFPIHFAFGILIAKHADWIFLKLSERKAWLWTLCVGGILLYSSRYTFFTLVPQLAFESVIFSATGLGSAFLLIFLLSHLPSQKVLNHSVFTFVGRISYSVYLFHFMLLLTVMPKILVWIGTFSIHAHLNWWLGVSAFTALVILFSAISYQTVEKSSIELGRKLQ